MNSSNPGPSQEDSSTDGGCDRKISISTRCKSCKRYFKKSTILKHIKHRKSCENDYTSEEIQAFRDWADETFKMKKKETFKSTYDPKKR